MKFVCLHIRVLCAHTSVHLYYLFSLLGEEVALYCSKYLPDIIKEQKAYKDGKLQKVRCIKKCLQDLNEFEEKCP